MKCFDVKYLSLAIVSALSVNNSVMANTESSKAKTPPHVKSSPENDLTLTALQKRIQALEHKQPKENKAKVFDPVLALPEINARGKYDAVPIYNQDLNILIMRKNYNHALQKAGIAPLPYPRIELGGNLVGLALANEGPDAPPINGQLQSDIQLSGANLNITSEILKYCLGAFRISYNPNAPFKLDAQYNAGNINTRVNNSSIYLNTGFITLGDLDKSPLYLSIGQMFLPFGDYTSNLATAILPARLGLFRQRTLLVGYQEPGKDTGFNFQAFGFRGDTRTGVDPKNITEENNSNLLKIKGGKTGVIDNGGLNLGYTGKAGGVKYGGGVSYVLNIADSGGMQNAGSSTIISNGGVLIDNSFLDDEDLEEFDDEVILNFPTHTFAGFGATRNYIVYQVPAVDLRARLAFDKLPISFMGEFVKTTKSFSPVNLSYNTNKDELIHEIGVAPENIPVDEALQYLHGAHPSAWHVEATYAYTMWDIPSLFTVGGGQSYQAMALNLPAAMMLGTLKLNFKKELSLALNYTYQNAYPSNAIGTGELQLSSTDKFSGTKQQMVSAQLTARF